MQFPLEELEIIDSTVRMFTEPVLQADVPMLADLWEKENQDKKTRLQNLGITATELQSSAKFAALLRAEGIEPPIKPGKKGDNFCFAKTDEFMRELLEHDDERIRTLAEARIGQKSTLLQTRAETLGFMARRGSCPVYLSYCGAHTTRWSGGDRANWQNFKRGSALRRAIMAPDGYLLAAIDLSQIECRILNYLAGQADVVEKFRNEEDPYVGIASAFYGRPITKADANERGTGKQAELSCGYGCGAPKFRGTARLGIYGPPVALSIEEAARFVSLYRSTHPAVTAYWRTAESLLPIIAAKGTATWGPMKIENGRIYGPGGTFLHYETLEWHVEEDGERYWRHRTRNGWTKLYGAKLVENVVQWLARIVMSQAMLRLKRRGYRCVNTTHDELLILLRQDGHEQQHVQECVNEMIREPTWLPGIPLAAEATVGQRYGK